MQIRGSDDYPKLCDVVGVTICNFKLWPTKIKGQGYKIPMLSRWRMQEQKSGHKGLRQIQYAFMELPKYSAGKAPETLIDKWAYFFREAKNLEVIPPALSEGPFREALEIARRSTFTDAEWTEYERAKMAEQDELGRISFAHRQGEHKGRIEGRIEGKISAVLAIFAARGVDVSATARAHIEACNDAGTLDRWITQAISAISAEELMSSTTTNDA